MKMMRLTAFMAIAATLYGCAAAAPGTTDLTTGLQGYWQFNGDGVDSSPNGRTLDLFGSPGFATGLFGTAIVFNANSSKYAQRPASDSVFDVGSSDFTIQTWVSFTATAGEQTIFEKWTGPGGPGYTLTKLPGNQLRLALAAGSEQDVDSGQLTIAPNVWHQLGARRYGTTFSLFFDGAKVATASISASVTPSPNPLLIGRRDGGQQNPINGLMDEVAFWSRALSDAELSLLYKGGNGLQISGQ